MVPLYLYEQALASGRDCRIVITQPRRLAAKGLAKRVSEQCQTPVGQVVGYRVGSDKNDRQAPIVYVTVGHMLEALVHNPLHLATFSHIVLDEVHERFIEADFLMTLLRLSLSRPETMSTRIVVMSATLQKALGNFFRPLLLPAPMNAEPGMLSLPGRTPFVIRDFDWDDVRSEWPMLHGCIKEPNFAELKPSKARQLTTRRRADQLTKLCKDLAPLCAKLLVLLRNANVKSDPSSCDVALVFLPGLDQMREMEEALRYELRGANPNVFLMHSALEEEVYRHALDPNEPGEWRIVLATNIAESSLTVPGVNVVVDFGMHRVNVYDDEIRMSMLATEWCSAASMQQRRGRTGRTTSGSYFRLLPRCVLEELSAFDESGVERAPLTRITLEAAHLSKVLNGRGLVCTGMPVDVGNGREGVVQFWDPTPGWRVAEPGSAPEAGVVVPEESLKVVRIDARHMLALLPSAPKEDRVQSALFELRELGAVVNDEPTVLGTACLKLPVDVPLGRLVVLGWMLGCSADAAVLAAALSTQSCDVLKTPFNTTASLEPWEVKQLRATVEERYQADRGCLSEPLTAHCLFFKWLQGGGALGYTVRDPRLSKVVHTRLWPQFTTKAVEVAEALHKLVPPGAEADALSRLVLEARRGGGGKVQSAPFNSRKLSMLLTLGLAPLGFVAVGQTPALYGGTWATFKQEIQTRGWEPARTLVWPKVNERSAKEIAQQCGANVQWSGSDRDEVFLCLEDMDGGAQTLCRICGPFNGKETFLSTRENQRTPVKPPRHPCFLNWYMPRRDGRGVLEVRVGWKSQAETLICIPPGKRVCRPKHFLVASGAEYQSVGGRRSILLRGITVLPDRDQGRSAALWLLAGGVPREFKNVVLAAPTVEGFEVRALRLWQRTFWFSKEDPVTNGDLQAVNDFRHSMLELRRRTPHRLAGTWSDGSGSLLHIESVAGAAEVLTVTGAHELTMSSDGRRWCAAGEVVCEEREEQLLWCDGSVWSMDEVRLLGMVANGTVCSVRKAAQHILDITDPDSERGGAARWPARLVPLHCQNDDFLAPFDLEGVQRHMVTFSSRLQESDVLSDGEDEDCCADDDDDTPDISQESVNEEFMWRLAEQRDWSPRDSRQITFVESAIALPPTPICVECEKQGQVFSKSQLSRHPDERRCEECVTKTLSCVYRPAGDAVSLPQGPTCSVCKEKLTKQNCSNSQRQKAPTRRKCNYCISGQAT